MAINFDMDGTIADFYGVEGWLDYLEANDPTPYLVARPLVNMSALARRIHRFQNLGVKVNIVTWVSKNADPEFEAIIAAAKRAWLKKHIPSVEWDAIIVLPYGTRKADYCSGILFDDEERNRDDWGENAYDVDNIGKVLTELYKQAVRESLLDELITDFTEPQDM